MVAMLKSRPQGYLAYGQMRVVTEEPAGAERRVFPRKEVHGHVEARRMDHTIQARQNPRLSLSLRDLSLGGLSALSDTVVAPGEKIGVFFPPQGSQRGWDAYGRVLRCQPSGTGYRVAVEFDPIPAAA